MKFYNVNDLNMKGLFVEESPPLLGEDGHALEQDGDDSLVEIGTGRQRLQVNLGALRRTTLRLLLTVDDFLHTDNIV